MTRLLSRFRLSDRRHRRSPSNLRRCGLEVRQLEGRLLLATDTTAPITVAAAVGTLGLNGFYVSPVTVNFSATDPDNTTAELTTSFSVNGGAETTGNSLTLNQDGIFTINFRSSDAAGNVEEASHTLIVKIDQTAPVVTATASPNSLWPPNHRSWTVVVSGAVTDNLSGLNTSLSWSVKDEYGQVQPNGTATVALSNPMTGTYSFDVSLQASRAGRDKDGRQYTILVTTTDQAGNAETVSTIVTVPHDRGHRNSASSGAAAFPQGGGGNNGASSGAAAFPQRGGGKGHGHGRGHAGVAAGAQIQRGDSGESDSGPQGLVAIVPDVKGKGRGHGQGQGHGHGRGNGNGHSKH
jgi:hypothetical protein